MALVVLLYVAVLARNDPERKAREEGAENREQPADSLWKRFGKLLLRVTGSVLIFVAVVVGAAFVLGRWIIDTDTPVPFWVVQLGAGVLAVTVVFVVAWWWRSYEVNVVGRKKPSYLTGLLLGFVAVGVLLGVLNKPAVNEKPSEQDQRATQTLAMGRFDLMLVVDPADPMGRALIQQAREELQAAQEGRDAGGLFRPRAPDPPYDIAYGLMVARRGDGAQPWRIVEPPTTDLREIRLALAALEPREGRPATSSYSRILYDLSQDGRMAWRPQARRGAALLLDELPDGQDFVPPDGLPRGRSALCDTLVDTWGERLGELPGTGPITWQQAMARQCRPRDIYRAWHRNGQVRLVRWAGSPLALQVVTREDAPEKLAAWRAWVGALDGRLRTSATGHDLDGFAAGELVRDVADMHTGVPVGELQPGGLGPSPDPQVRPRRQARARGRRLAAGSRPAASTVGDHALRPAAPAEQPERRRRALHDARGRGSRRPEGM